MVEGRNQSVLSDAWAKSAQILEFPERMPSGWEITIAAKTKLREQLSRDCDGFRVVVSMELSRENPEVGVLAGMGGRTRRQPRQSGRQNYRGSSANIRRRENGGSFLHETAFLDAIPADLASQSNATNSSGQSNFDNFDNFNNLKRTSYIEIPQLSGFSVSLIFRFPRLFYLSNSREIRFVDKEKPRFDSLFVHRIRSNPS